MAPLDLDYTLVFPKSRFREVVDALRPLCTSDTESALAGLLGPAPVEVVVAFRSWPDMPAAMVDDFPKIDSQVRRLGDIKIYRSRASIRPGHAFRIWPSTRQLQRAIFGSSLLRRELIRILEACQGHLGYICVEQCDPVVFWDRSAGPNPESDLWCLGSWYTNSRIE